MQRVLIIQYQCQLLMREKPDISSIKMNFCNFMLLDINSKQKENYRSAISNDG